MKLIRNEIFSKIPEIGHCFTTRKGGVSGAAGDGMNLSFGKDKDPAHMKENVRRVALACGFSPEKTVMAKQIHSDRVIRVRAEDGGNWLRDPASRPEADALITDEPGLVLVTTHGDCIPVYLWDPKKKAVGMVHSGWRGTAARIAGKTAEAMKREFGTEAGDLMALIGPGICVQCFCADMPVAEEFYKAFPENREIVTYCPGREKYLVDLPEAVKLTLLSAGVPENQIVKSGECTCCPENRDVYYSHRREKGTNEGLMGAFLWVRETSKGEESSL